MKKAKVVAAAAVAAAKEGSLWRLIEDPVSAGALQRGIIGKKFF